MTMQTLPAGISPASAAPTYVDYGFIQEAAGGAALTRIDRPGNRFEVALVLPPLPAAKANQLLSRLMRARGDGIRVDYPLLGAGQGTPGSTVVDGATSAGRILKVRAGTPGHVVKEGYWLTLVAADGTRYLHCAASQVTLDGTGKATLTIDPPLRAIPADGWQVILDAPTVEGLVTSATSWAITPDQLVSQIAFTLREIV